MNINFCGIREEKTRWDTAGSKSRNESADWTAALFEWTKSIDLYNVVTQSQLH